MDRKNAQQSADDIYVALLIGDAKNTTRRHLAANTSSSPYSNQENRQKLPNGKRYREGVKGTLMGKPVRLYRLKIS